MSAAWPTPCPTGHPPRPPWTPPAAYCSPPTPRPPSDGPHPRRRQPAAAPPVLPPPPPPPAGRRTRRRRPAAAPPPRLPPPPPAAHRPPAAATAAAGSLVAPPAPAVRFSPSSAAAAYAAVWPPPPPLPPSPPSYPPLSGKRLQQPPPSPPPSFPSPPKPSSRPPQQPPSPPGTEEVWRALWRSRAWHVSGDWDRGRGVQPGGSRLDVLSARAERRYAQPHLHSGCGLLWVVYAASPAAPLVNVSTSCPGERAASGIVKGAPLIPHLTSGRCVASGSDVRRGLRTRRRSWRVCRRANLARVVVCPSYGAILADAHTNHSRVGMPCSLPHTRTGKPARTPPASP